MVPLMLAMILASSPAWAQSDECYRPPLPAPCQPHTQTMGEHLRCLVSDRDQARSYARQIETYHECKHRATVRR